MPDHRTKSARRAAGLTLTLLLLTGALTPASAWECKAINQKGEERDCTFTERLGKCLSEAYDSRAQCLARASNILENMSCHVAFGLDKTACLVGSPFQHLLATLE